MVDSKDFLNEMLLKFEGAKLDENEIWLKWIERQICYYNESLKLILSENKINFQSFKWKVEENENFLSEVKIARSLIHSKISWIL